MEAKYYDILMTSITDLDPFETDEGNVCLRTNSELMI